MKKELVIAILIGLLIGFGLAAGFWSKTKTSSIKLGFLQKNNQQKNDNITTVTPKPTIEKDKEVQLKIINPENEIVHEEEDLTVQGKTNPNATVVVIWEEGEDILVANDDGSFETKITLIGGENKVKVTAYNDNGDKTSQTLTVTYSTADF